MKKKWIVLILAAAMGTSVTACQKAAPDVTETMTSAIVSTEEVTTAAVSSEEKTEVVTEAATKKKPQEDTEDLLQESTENAAASEKLINNNGYFVQYEGNVFCHAPDVEGMNRAALWGEYLMYPSGSENVLLQIDEKTGEAKVISQDYGYGKLALSGGYITYRMHAEYDFMYTSTDGVVFRELPGHETNSEEPWCDGISAGGDKEGHYVVGYQYHSAEETFGNNGYYLTPFKDGKELEGIYAGGEINPVGVEGNQFIYRESLYDYSGEYPVFVSEILIQADLDSGALTILGDLPVYDEGYPIVDQAEIKNGKVYMTYSRYDGGSSSFYQDTLLVVANLGEENSLVWSRGEDAVSEYGEKVRAKAFYVTKDTVEFCDGVPGSAAVVGNDIGYYDEKGHFIKVASGYAPITDDTGDGSMENIEIVEKVGDYLYAVRNSSIHEPSQDVGWRMAYLRNNTQVIRISIATQKEEILYEVYRRN